MAENNQLQGYSQERFVYVAIIPVGKCYISIYVPIESAAVGAMPKNNLIGWLMTILSMILLLRNGLKPIKMN